MFGKGEKMDFRGTGGLSEMQNFNCDFNARWIAIAALGHMASYLIPKLNPGFMWNVGGLSFGWNVVGCACD